MPSNKVHFNTHTDKERDDVSLYGTPKEEVGTVNTSRWLSKIVLVHIVLTLNIPRNSVSSESKPGWVRNQLQNIFAPTDNKLAMKLFGSKKALMKERVRQKAIGHWIIHPCSSFR